MIERKLQHLKHTVSRFSEFARLPQAKLVETDPGDVMILYDTPRGKPQFTVSLPRTA